MLEFVSVSYLMQRILGFSLHVSTSLYWSLRIIETRLLVPKELWIKRHVLTIFGSESFAISSDTFLCFIINNKKKGLACGKNRQHCKLVYIYTLDSYRECYTYAESYVIVWTGIVL